MSQEAWASKTFRKILIFDFSILQQQKPFVPGPCLLTALGFADINFLDMEQLKGEQNTLLRDVRH